MSVAIVPSNRVVDKQTAALVHYAAMCREIAHCARVDEVKNIRDKAMALAVYAKQALNQEAERQAAEIRLRAEIRAGELLGEMKETGQRDSDKGGDRRSRSGDTTVKPQLADLGITKEQSSQWQQVAAIPKREREAYFADTSQIPTAGGLLSTHKAKHTPKPQMPKMDPNALWVWGRLCDFERDGILKLKAEILFMGMTAPMQEDVARIAPLVFKWLSAFPRRKSETKKRSREKSWQSERRTAP
jgi:hypothetical protein